MELYTGQWLTHLAVQLGNLQNYGCPCFPFGDHAQPLVSEDDFILNKIPAHFFQGWVAPQIREAECLTFSLKVTSLCTSVPQFTHHEVRIVIE